ncbi:MAG: hypothetical protein EA385_15740 [Salinarimonadaceae bacterium]|nr:MAG: hypothetical protein EA385_15740 [Salinarimonadaceae bacterium]
MNHGTLSSVVDDMAQIFEGGVKTNGVHIDAELCGVFAEALREMQQSFAACEAYMAAQTDLIQALQPPAPQPRRPSASAPSGSSNVVRFTARRPSARTRDRDGGDAA